MLLVYQYFSIPVLILRYKYKYKYDILAIFFKIICNLEAS